MLNYLRQLDTNLRIQAIQRKTSICSIVLLAPLWLARAAFEAELLECADSPENCVLGGSVTSFRCLGLMEHVPGCFLPFLTAHTSYLHPLLRAGIKYLWIP